MVYTIDVDGSMKPASSINTTGASTLVGSDDGRLLEFVDNSKCTKVDPGCYSYCSDTCFRSTRFDLNVPDTAAYSIKVCLRENHSKCTTFKGGRREDTHSYTLTVHLPVGIAYDAIFVSVDGTQASPPFRQSTEPFFCPPEALYDVTIVNNGLTIEAVPRVTTVFQSFLDFLARILQIFHLSNFFLENQN